MVTNSNQKENIKATIEEKEENNEGYMNSKKTKHGYHDLVDSTKTT
jgi:hypothetical protein